MFSPDLEAYYWAKKGALFKKKKRRLGGLMPRAGPDRAWKGSSSMVSETDGPRLLLCPCSILYKCEALAVLQAVRWAKAMGITVQKKKKLWVSESCGFCQILYN